MYVQSTKDLTTEPLSFCTTEMQTYYIGTVKGIITLHPGTCQRKIIENASVELWGPTKHHHQQPGLSPSYSC